MEMHDCCTQCGREDAISWLFGDIYDLFSCKYCGYSEKFAHELDEHTSHKGFGLKHYTYNRNAKLGKGLTENFLHEVDYVKEIEDFDNAVSTGLILPEESYLTKAEGSQVTFLRGNMESFLRYIA